MDSPRCCIALRSGFATPLWLSSCVHRLKRAEHHLSPHMSSCSVWEPPSEDRIVACNEPTRHFELRKFLFCPHAGRNANSFASCLRPVRRFTSVDFEVLPGGSFALCVALRIIHFKPATASRPIVRGASGEHARAAVVNAEGDGRSPAGTHSDTAGARAHSSSHSHLRATSDETIPFFICRRS